MDSGLDGELDGQDWRQRIGGALWVHWGPEEGSEAGSQEHVRWEMMVA